MRLFVFIFTLVLSFNMKQQSLDHDHLQLPMDQVFNPLLLEIENPDVYQYSGVSVCVF